MLLTKKHLFDFRYLLLRTRTFSLVNASVLLSPERGYADPPYYFPGSARESALSENTCLITFRTLGGISCADRENEPFCTVCVVHTCILAFLVFLHSARCYKNRQLSELVKRKLVGLQVSPSSFERVEFLVVLLIPKK